MIKRSPWRDEESTTYTGAIEKAAELSPDQTEGHQRGWSRAQVQAVQILDLLAECRPEEMAKGVRFWPRPFPFQHRDLLSEGEYFEGCIASTVEDFEHGLTFNTS